MTTTNKPTCGFCSNTGHTWATPEGKRICFQCLLKQRNEYRDQCQHQAEEIAALQEKLTNVFDRPVLPHAVGMLVGLRSEIKALHERTGRLLAQLEEKS